MKFLQRLDENIISVVQKSYLWLLDRTGVYVSTIGLLLFAGASCCIQWREFNAWLIAFLIFLGSINLLILGHRYWLQGSGNTKVYNAIAQGHNDNLMIRWFFVSQMMMFLLIDLIIMDGRGVAMNAMFIIYNFIPSIMIRDRDKKPFFETKQALAMEGAR